MALIRTLCLSSAPYCKPQTSLVPVAKADVFVSVDSAPLLAALPAVCTVSATAVSAARTEVQGLDSSSFTPGQVVEFTVVAKDDEGNPSPGTVPCLRLWKAC